MWVTAGAIEFVVFLAHLRMALFSIFAVILVYLRLFLVVSTI